MDKLKNLLLWINTTKQVDTSLVTAFISTAKKHGCNIYSREIYDIEEVDSMIEFIGSYKLNNIDAAFIFGGDGSIISAVHNLHGYDIPLIGINYGRVGFLAEIEINEMQLMDDILEGKFRIEERMMFDVKVYDSENKEKASFVALNDAVMSNGPIPKILSFDLVCDGITMQTCKADGFIISTPTGSTAYSLSAGGPVLDPKIDCMCLVQICPHTLGNRSIILQGNSTVELKNIQSKGNTVHLTSDGRESIEIDEKDRVLIKKSEHSTKLIRVKSEGFLGVLRDKLAINN